tara:strand:- start:1188 stop:2201 length:1014 start_codon:yes stop_codon:yes gene_type:complete
MSCGLGAVALMLIFIKTSISPSPEIAADLISKTQNQIKEYQDKNELIKENIESKDLNIKNLLNEINNFQKKIEISNRLIRSNELTKNSLKQEIESIEQDENPIVQDYKSNYQGYLSGCNVSGNKVGIFLDNSSSMYDKSIIDIIRFRASSDTIKATSKKWNQAKEIFKWLLEKSQNTTQIISGTFSEEIELINAEYLTYSEIINSNEYSNIMNKFPSGGTNLDDISKIMNKEKFDNIYIITDGLPTLPTLSKNDSNSIRGKIKKFFNEECYNNKTVTPSCRKALFFKFNDSVKSLKTSINIIMMPLEGDFTAHYYFSKLAKETNGCFITSSKDWLIK